MFKQGQDSCFAEQFLPGRHAAQFLANRGAVLVAAADSLGTIYSPNGLDIGKLTELKQSGGSVTHYADGKKLDCDAVVDIECDIWIPAARPDVIREDNVNRLKTKLVIEGANIPITPGAEAILADRGVVCIPDFIANAGGVICAAMEYQGATESSVLQSIEEKLRRNTRRVLEDVSKRNILPRQSAVELALARVRKAMSFRRYSLLSTAPGFT